MAVLRDFIQGEYMDLILCFRERRGNIDRFWAAIVGRDPTTPAKRSTLRLYWGAINYALLGVDYSLVRTQQQGSNFIRRVLKEPHIIYPPYDSTTPDEIMQANQFLRREARNRLEQKWKQGYVPVQLLEDSLRDRLKLASAVFQVLKFRGESPPDPLPFSSEKVGPAEPRKENIGRWKPDAGFTWF